MDDEAGWHVMIEEQDPNRGMWILSQVIPVPGDREDARRFAVDRAHYHRPETLLVPMKEQGRQVFRLSDDTWFSIVHGATGSRSFQARVAELIYTSADD